MVFLQITFASLILGILHQSSLSLKQGCPPETIVQPCVCKESTLYTLSSFHCEGINEQTGDEKLRKAILAVSEYDVTVFDLWHSVIYVPAQDTLLQGSNFKKVVIHNVTFDSLDLFAFVSGVKHTLTDLSLSNVFASNWHFSTSANDFRSLVYLSIYMGRDAIPPILPEDFLSLLPKTMRILYFENVRGGDIAEPGLSQFSHLESVSFAAHNLYQIDRNIFPKPAARLEYLDLKNNSLTSLPDDFFEGMPALDGVVLYFNQFTHLDEKTFDPVWKQLKYLILEGNPLHCGCEAAWLVRKKPGPQVELPNCASPPHLNGRNLASIPISELC